MKQEIAILETKTEEEKENNSSYLEVQKWAISNKEVYRRYFIGDLKFTEFGLQQDGKNIKI